MSGNGGYYMNTAEWQTDTRNDAGFSIAFPLDFPTNDIYSVAPVSDWRVNSANASGRKLLTITVPKAFEPQTNFSEAIFTVGKSSDQTAVQNCLKPDQTESPTGAALNGATTTINGVPFSIFKSASAGAGNFYETTSYRTIHLGACYAVEYTLHSTQIGNYPSEYHLQAFDPNQVSAVLDRIVGTFKFLQ